MRISYWSSDVCSSDLWQVHVIDDVIADPPERIVLEAAELARKSGAEIIVGLGGGSSMDVAKLLAILLGSDQPLTEMYGIGNVRGKRLPLVQIPTTAGTGSEVTPVSIVTTAATTKSGVVDRTSVGWGKSWYEGVGT